MDWTERRITAVTQEEVTVQGTALQDDNYRLQVCVCDGVIQSAVLVHRVTTWEPVGDAHVSKG